ncbi:MAG: hypothetical protein ABI881_11095 [Betaproteobacteria bacterium]
MHGAGSGRAAATHERRVRTAIKRFYVGGNRTDICLMRDRLAPADGVLRAFDAQRSRTGTQHGDLRGEDNSTSFDLRWHSAGSPRDLIANNNGA